MNSLIISDKEKYGEDSPGCCVPSGANEKAKPEDRKSAPTVELTGPQVEAFGLSGTANLEQTGCAKIYFKVKSVRAGESYGDSVTTSKSPTKITIQLTGVEPLEDEAPEEPEGELESEDDNMEDSAEEGESPEGKTSTSADPEQSATDNARKKQLSSIKVASERVSPKEASLPE